VPLAVIADFDVLNDEQPLRSIAEAAGGNWESVENDWREVKCAIDSKKPELSTDQVKKDIQETLETATGPMSPTGAKRQVQDVLRRSSPWSIAKSVGMQFVPSGQPSQACARLFASLESAGVFIVPVGELEGFCKTVGGHGPAWVAEVLKKDLAMDRELNDARSFVSKANVRPD
jgi:hypothetical protein